MLSAGLCVFDEIESLRQQLAECERERVFQANAHKMAQDALLEQGQQLATVTKERDELVEVVSKAVKLNSFREFNDHIPAMKAAIAKVGAGDTATEGHNDLGNRLAATGRQEGENG